MTAAIVLAAGPGSRLGDLGARMAKTIIPVAGRPYLEHLVGRLLREGLDPIVVAVHHHAETIVEHFAAHPQRSRLVFVTTAQEGTGADLRRCVAALPAGVEQFIVWNGDTIIDVDLDAVLRTVADDPTRGVIVLTRTAGVPNENAWYVDTDHTVLASLEARPPSAPPERYAWRASSTGLVLLHRSLLDAHPSTDLYTGMLPALADQGRLSAYDNAHRYFLDFGTPADLARIDHTQVAGWIA
jgi:NDP-sugar pyrophosphorylase family protein